MAAVQPDDSEEEVKVQSDTTSDKMSKKYIFFGVLAVTAAALVYTIIKNSNPNK